MKRHHPHGHGGTLLVPAGEPARLPDPAGRPLDKIESNDRRLLVLAEENRLRGGHFIGSVLITGIDIAGFRGLLRGQSVRRSGPAGARARTEVAVRVRAAPAARIGGSMTRLATAPVRAMSQVRATASSVGVRIKQLKSGTRRQDGSSSPSKIIRGISGASVSARTAAGFSSVLEQPKKPGN